MLQQHVQAPVRSSCCNNIVETAVNSIVNNVVARVQHNIAASCSTGVNNLLTMLRQHDDFCACRQAFTCVLVSRVTAPTRVTISSTGANVEQHNAEEVVKPRLN